MFVGQLVARRPLQDDSSVAQELQCLSKDTARKDNMVATTLVSGRVLLKEENPQPPVWYVSNVKRAGGAPESYIRKLTYVNSNLLDENINSDHNSNILDYETTVSSGPNLVLFLIGPNQA